MIHKHLTDVRKRWHALQAQKRAEHTRRHKELMSLPDIALERMIAQRAEQGLNIHCDLDTNDQQVRRKNLAKIVACLECTRLNGHAERKSD